jgi:hypothetical protein
MATLICCYVQMMNTMLVSDPIFMQEKNNVFTFFYFKIPFKSDLLQGNQVSL